MKAYQCSYEDCRAKFRTSTDLHRHQNSKHSSRSQFGYQCNAKGCDQLPKVYRRVDNFRDHVRRKHDLNDHDLANFIEQ